MLPLTLEPNEMLVVPPLQKDCGLAEPTGLGFTVIVAVIGLPTQKVGAGPVGVIMNVTVTSDVVVLVNVVPVIFPEPLDAIPVTFPLDKLPLSLVHAKVVPDTTGLVPSVIVVNAFPEQIVWLLFEAVAEGKGLTVTTTALVAVHPVAVIVSVNE